MWIFASNSETIGLLGNDIRYHFNDHSDDNDAAVSNDRCGHRQISHKKMSADNISVRIRHCGIFVNVLAKSAHRDGSSRTDVQLGNQEISHPH